MTGYGRGDCSKDGFKVTVELSSVNRKQTEISVNLPRELELLEAQIRDLINRHIARGRLTARVTFHACTGKSSARMHLNVPLAKAYARELGRLAKQLKVDREQVRGKPENFNRPDYTFRLDQPEGQGNRQAPANTEDDTPEHAFVGVQARAALGQNDRRCASRRTFLRSLHYSRSASRLAALRAQSSGVSR